MGVIKFKKMPTDKKTIKSYNGYAAKWAQKLRSGNNYAHTFLEKPAMYKKLPNLKGKSVLCIGCGTGGGNASIFKFLAQKKSSAWISRKD